MLIVLKRKVHLTKIAVIFKSTQFFLKYDLKKNKGHDLDKFIKSYLKEVFWHCFLKMSEHSIGSVLQ